MSSFIQCDRCEKWRPCTSAVRAKYEADDDLRWMCCDDDDDDDDDDDGGDTNTSQWHCADCGKMRRTSRTATRCCDRPMADEDVQAAADVPDDDDEHGDVDEQPRRKSTTTTTTTTRTLLCTSCQQWRSVAASDAVLDNLAASPVGLVCCDVPPPPVSSEHYRGAGEGGRVVAHGEPRVVACSLCSKNRVPFAEGNDDIKTATTCCGLLGSAAGAGSSLLTRAQLKELSSSTPQSASLSASGKGKRPLKLCLCGSDQPLAKKKKKQKKNDSDGMMIQCDNCNTWFHDVCVGVDCAVAPLMWLCADCVAHPPAEEDGDDELDVGDEEDLAMAVGPSEADVVKEDTVLCHLHPQFLLIKGDFEQIMSLFPQEHRFTQLVVTDPPSGMCEGIYDWDEAISPWSFWTSIRNVANPKTVVNVLAGASQFVPEIIIRNRDVNNILLQNSKAGSVNDVDASIIRDYLRAELMRPTKAPRGSRNSESRGKQPALPVYKYSFYWLNNNMGYPIAMHKMPMRFLEDIAVFYRHRDTLTYHPPSIAVPNIDPRFRPMKSEELTQGSASAKYYFNADLRKSASNFLPIPFQDFEVAIRRKHPHRKPRRLLQYLVETYSNEGEVVLDPFMGSGTAGEASVSVCRRFLGIERNRTHFFSSVKHIDPDGAGTTLKIPKSELTKLVRNWASILTNRRMHPIPAWDNKAWDWTVPLQ